MMPDHANRVRNSQLSHRIREMAGVRPDDDRLCQCGGLDHVAAVLARPEINQRSADDDNIRQRVELAQLPHGVAEDDLRWIRSCRIRSTKERELTFDQL